MFIRLYGLIKSHFGIISILFLLQKNKEYVSIASGGFMGKVLIYSLLCFHFSEEIISPELIWSDQIS